MSPPPHPVWPVSGRVKQSALLSTSPVSGEIALRMGATMGATPLGERED